MMRVTLIGTGEAFDASLPNTSVMVEAGGTAILVDCGFSAVQSFWQLVPDPSLLDALYVTHFHADHCFGIPALLLRMHEEGRTRPLAVLASPERFRQVTALFEAGYPGFCAKLRFELVNAAIPEGGPGDWRGIRVRTAATRHGALNLAVRLDFPAERSLMVSGDGEITPESAALFDGCSLVVHEAYRTTEHTPGHSSIREVLDAAASCSVSPRLVALVHRSRHEPQPDLSALGDRVLLPAPGTVLEVE
jgi:ribonuclease BN (tRNA processing enzyme)